MIQRIKLQAPEWSTLGDRGLLALINEVDHLMMNADIEHNVVINAATGFPPFLATTGGTRQYNCPDDCRKVATVFFEDFNIYTDRSRRYGERQTLMFLDQEFYEEPVVSRRRTINSDGTTQNATVTFRDNPGATTEVYYLKYYRLMTDITSVNIQPNVPPDYHYLLIDGVLARIQPIQYGKENPWLAWVERMKAEFWGEMNYNPPRYNKLHVRPC